MCSNLLRSKPIHNMNQTIIGLINVWIIDLVWITSENNFRSFTRTGYNGFDLVRRQILGLVNNHILRRNRPTADISKRLNLHNTKIDQLFM